MDSDCAPLNCHMISNTPVPKKFAREHTLNIHHHEDHRAKQKKKRGLRQKNIRTQMCKADRDLRYLKRPAL